MTRRSAMVCVRMAARSLMQQRRRSALLASAVASVTCLLVLLNGMASGMGASMRSMATTLTSGEINVAGFYKVSSSQFSPAVTESDEVVKVVRRVLPQLPALTRRGRGWAKVISQTSSMQTGITGLDIQQEPRFRQAISVLSGDIRALSQPNTILIFEEHAKKLSLKVGDVVTLSAQTTKGVANTADCRVIAIAKDVGLLAKFNMFVSNETLRSLYEFTSTTTGALHLDLGGVDPQTLDRTSARLRRALEGAGFRMMELDPRPFWMKFESVSHEDWVGQKLDVTTWRDELSFITWTLDLFQALAFTLVFILMIIVMMGILNTVWIAIRERTREIGTLRAIGMQRGDVVLLFLSESFVLGLLGAATGAVCGVAIAFVLNHAALKVPPSVQLFLMSDRLSVVISPRDVLLSVAGVALVSAVATCYPALKASRLRPIDAMSHKG